MDKPYFFGKCEELSLSLGIDCPNNLTLNQYYEEFIKLNDKRFDEIIKHLKTNSKYKRFPLIWDFKESQKATHRENTYKQYPEEENDHEEYREFFEGLQKKFSIPEYERTNKINNDDDHHHYKKRSVLFSEKKKANQIYSLKLRKWVDKSLESNIGGEFRYP